MAMHGWSAPLSILSRRRHAHITRLAPLMLRAAAPDHPVLIVYPATAGCGSLEDQPA